jgi:cytosine/uracil/thiamine/allantoin permease
VPGFVNLFLPGPHDGFFDKLYTYAWFVTFFLAFVIYYILMLRQPTADTNIDSPGSDYAHA